MADQGSTSMNQNCRNHQGPHVGKDNPPPCIHHPTGTLRYEFHVAYDQIDQNTHTRKRVTPILIRGAFQRNIYTKMDKALIADFDKNPETYNVTDIVVAENAAVFNSAKAVLSSCVGQAIGNSMFEMDDDVHYMDIAFRTFIAKTHSIWLERRDNARKRPPPGAADENDGDSDNIEVASVQNKRSRREQQPRAQRLAVRDVDTPAINNGEIDESLTNIETLSANLSAAANAHSVTIRTEVGNLEARIAELEARNRQLQDNNNLLRTQASGAAAQLAQTVSDIGNLGAALCEQTGIRHNSQTAILNELGARNNLSDGLIDRLMHNGKFREKWPF